jgi:radical SAM protein with 4Fe4S-binding SPASM domain
MLNVTKLYCGISQPADALRYGQGEQAPRTAQLRRPVVVWNITRTCNLRCVHCYAGSEAKPYPGELTLPECKALLADLAQFKVPAVLLSGGEPLVHPHFFKLAGCALSLGLRLTLSTNGILINPQTAARLRAFNFAYVGISLDGIGEAHDKFRGREGAFALAVEAFRNCKAAGQKAGLRLTLSRNNIADLDRILDFVEAEAIERVCFYHLVHSGRGADLQMASLQETRAALDRIISRTAQWAKTGREVLTVGQPVDGVYLYLRLLREGQGERAAEARKLLEWNGGGAFGSGVGIGNIDSFGNVHPDQFWQTHTIGNVRHQPFSAIWQNSQDPLLLGLRRRDAQITGRCAQCQFLKLCGGGFRVRAAHATGNPWAPDPSCYLTDAEIAENPK